MIWIARRVAFGIISGKNFYFGVQKRLRAFLNPIFTGGFSKTKNRRRFPFGGLS